MTTDRDHCPKWAEELISQIAALEIRLGNVTGETQWLSTELDKLMQKTADDYGTADESAVESLFRKVSRNLAAEGFDADTIASFINARVAVKMRLPYCDADEVRQALI